MTDDAGFRTEPPEFVIFDAPDISTILKHHPSPRAREYEEKINSVLKAATFSCLRNGNVYDGATLIDKGPSFSRAAANLTDVSPGAAKVIDFLTTPENPYWAFAFISLTFGMQLLRNHEAQAREAASHARMTWRERRAMRKLAKQDPDAFQQPRERHGPKLTMHLPFGRKLTLHIPVPKPSFAINILRSQTHDPAKRAAKVLSDEKVIKALAREGITISVIHPAQEPQWEENE